MQIYVICDLHTYLSLWLFLTLEVVFYIFVYFHYLFRLHPLDIDHCSSQRHLFPLLRDPKRTEPEPLTSLLRTNLTPLYYSWGLDYKFIWSR
jgi:hypothetical protein